MNFKIFIPITYIFFFFLNLEAQSFNSQELYLKYISYPKIIYDKQRFTVKLEAKVLSNKNSFEFINATYKNDKNIEILTSEIIWKNIGNSTYTTEIVYKIRNKDFKLPIIRLSTEVSDEDNYFGNKEIKYIEIKPPKIIYSKIAINQENFSNIIATDLKIKEVQIKQYNNQMLMVVCNLETINGNLEEFHLKQFDDQGINSFEDDYPIQSMFYYIIVPSHINNIKFNYYNPSLLKFIDVQLPILLEESLVSTQTDLNPNNGNLLLYKQIITIILLILCIVLYYISKNKIFIISSSIFLLIAIKLFMPNEKITIQKNTKIYILPTKLSTIYKTTNETCEVEVLMRKKDFLKVLFKNKNIGWIKSN